MRARRQARSLSYACILLVRWRILTDEPNAPERGGQLGRMPRAALLHGDACLLTTREQRLRLTAAERIARDRRRRRRLAEQLCHRCARADEDPAARRLEPHAVGIGLRNERRKARPARGGLHRIFGDDEDFVQAQRLDIRRAPHVLGRELLYELDATLRHL